MSNEKESGPSKPPGFTERLSNAIPDAPEPVVFYAVLAAEVEAIRERRRAAKTESSKPLSAPLNEHLTGIALSGGGIRSATFNLGVLQGLGSEVLRRFDYLSTVSGGGFIGGWWSAFVTRTGLLFPSPEQTELSREEQYIDANRRREGLKEGSMYAVARDPIHHLRIFSNYLTPRKGGLSNDSWRAVTTVVRNLILTWLILLPMLLAVMFASNLYFAVSLCTRDDYPNLVRTADPPKETTATTAKAGVAKKPPFFPREALQAIENVGVFFLTLITMAVIAWMLALHERWRWWDFIIYPASGVLTLFLVVWATHLFQTPPFPAKCSLLDLMCHPLVLATWVLIAACFLAQFVRACYRRELDLARSIAFNLQQRLLVIWFLITAALTIAGLGPWFVRYIFVGANNAAIEAGGWVALLATAAAAVFTAIKASPAGGADQKSSHGTAARIVFAIAPPLLILVLALGCSALANFLVGEVVEKYRQIQSGIPRTLVNQVILTTMTIFAVLGIFELLVKFVGWRRTGGWTKLRLTLQSIAWLAIGVAVLILSLRGKFSDIPSSWDYIPFWPFILIAAAITIIVFAFEWFSGDRESLRSPSLLFLAVVGLFALPTIVWLANLSLDAYRVNVHATFGLLMLTLGWVAGAGWLADPNALSMHLFYKSRLVRAYLGASNEKREGYEITETAPGDDIKLCELRNTEHGAPYHILNTTLNLVAASDLATAQRSAANFELSRLYCGSLRTGYRETGPLPGSARSLAYMGGGLTLGTAVAISGAAASPNMGAKTMSGAMAMLMTLFNVRLGYWAPTPHRGFWHSPQARLWPIYMLQEFLSQTNDLLPYCYLTDGGHFDNTGAYALVARACRTILIVDCGADSKRTFDDIGDLIRRCRIDFCAEIDLDVTRFLDPNRGRPYMIDGTVTYSSDHLRRLDIHSDKLEGKILVIKPTVNESENADILQYARTHDVFPQQTTADQWFDEAQFESYRSLGQRSGESALTSVARALAGHC